MGKNAILVRTLASERINETAPATGDDKFSYSSVIDNQVLRRRKKKRIECTDGSPGVLDGI